MESLFKVEASDVVLATGGIGGLYRHSTNFRHLTGDAIAIAIKHGVELKGILIMSRFIRQHFILTKRKTGAFLYLNQ